MEPIDYITVYPNTENCFGLYCYKVGRNKHCLIHVGQFAKHCGFHPTNITNYINPGTRAFLDQIQEMYTNLTVWKKPAPQMRRVAQRRHACLLELNAIAIIVCKYMSTSRQVDHNRIAKAMRLIDAIYDVALSKNIYPCRDPQTTIQNSPRPERAEKDFGKRLQAILGGILSVKSDVHLGKSRQIDFIVNGVRVEFDEPFHGVESDDAHTIRIPYRTIRGVDAQIGYLLKQLVGRKILTVRVPKLTSRTHA